MPLRSTVSDERLSSLAFFHVPKHKEADRRRPSYLRVCWEERSKTIPVPINIATCNTKTNAVRRFDGSTIIIKAK